MKIISLIATVMEIISITAALMMKIISLTAAVMLL
jgi:hypothetical protein